MDGLCPHGTMTCHSSVVIFSPFFSPSFCRLSCFIGFIPTFLFGYFLLSVTSLRSPTVVGSLDTSQFDMEFTSMMPVVSPDVRDAYFGSLDRAFVGFTFIDDSALGNNGHKNNFGTSVRSGPGATLMATSFGAAGRR